MNRNDLNEQIEAFFAKGGKVTSVAEGQRTDPGLNGCRCGCHGNYTDHSMRAGESGRPSHVIVR